VEVLLLPLGGGPPVAFRVEVLSVPLGGGTPGAFRVEVLPVPLGWRASHAVCMWRPLVTGCMCSLLTEPEPRGVFRVGL